MNALLFPGQGSQMVKMGSEFYNNFEIVKKIFSDADEKLNFSLSKIILDGPEEKLTLTENTQPAILTVSYSIFSVLVCSGSLKFTDAIYLLQARGKAMQEAVPVGKGSMIAILGSKFEDIQKLILSSNINGVCEIANDNADGQVIVSGNKDSVSQFQQVLKEKKKKFIPLKVSAPFHCSLMKSAAEIMKEKIEKTIFEKPQIKIVSNVTALPENGTSKIKRLLIEQIFNTVRWRETLLKMSSSGVSNFIEIGPGKVLSGMVKRTLKKVNCFSINSITDIKNLKNEFKK